jgi:D-alanyl-D-alanine carboxypeptidase
MLFLSRSISLRVAVALLTSLIMISFVSAQAPPSSSAPLFSPQVTEQLNSSLTALMQKENLPSVEVSIDQPGKGTYSFVRGSANLESATPRQPNQPFRIASITKPFAAIAILALVDTGKLRTDDTISKWYPAFPNASSITIDDLLKMRSGIPAPNDDEVLARVYDAPLAAAPTFDNEMQSYAALRAHFKQPDSPGGLRGYGLNPSTQKFEDKTLFNPALAGAAGAVISNAHDLHIFVLALCHGTLLKPTTFRYQMEAKPLEGTNASYGAGVATGSGVCGHSGTINGFSSDMYYFEKLNATLVISVTRLDRDNHSRSAAVLELVSHTMLSALSSP